MGLRIVHISDTHGSKFHTKLNIPECDLLIHSGDIGGRTNPFELVEFLHWFESQPGRMKIYVPGNHDLCLDKNWVNRVKYKDPIQGLIAEQWYNEYLTLSKNYNVKILADESIEFEGYKIYGSPYSPSFHREHWSFNADRGDEISKVWSKIPSDTNILITHTPCHNILDMIPDKYVRPDETNNVGCEDLLRVIKKRLLKLQLHCSGHIHDNYGILMHDISNTRKIMFSNGAVLSNDYELIIKNPYVINL